MHTMHRRIIKSCNHVIIKILPFSLSLSLFLALSLSISLSLILFVWHKNNLSLSHTDTGTHTHTLSGSYVCLSLFFSLCMYSQGPGSSTLAMLLRKKNLYTLSLSVSIIYGMSWRALKNISDEKDKVFQERTHVHHYLNYKKLHISRIIRKIVL